VPGPDWADLFDASGNRIPGALATFGGLADAFIADPSAAGGATDPTTFSGFGTSNKNDDPISTADCSANTYPSCTPWGWAPGNEPSKDDLTNVYAYETTAAADQAVPDAIKKGDLILYAGAEREDPSGDSHIDFEFFQNAVSLCTPTPPATTCSSFVGTRKPGDVILSMDFLKGGNLGSVTVRRFNGTSFDLEGTASGVGCATNDVICAFNNEVPIDGGPWPNRDNHGNVITTLPTNAFTEIGVDLTNLIGASPCLSTFMSKTRSSGSFTAELKDFAGPVSFAPCVPHTTLTKTASPTKVESGGSVTYTYTELNDGSDPINLTSETDNHCSPVTPTLGADNVHNIGDTNTNGILDPGETWTFTCTTTLTATTTNTATFVGTDTLSGATVTETATATVTVIHPATLLLKKAQVNITYTFYEKNTGDDPIVNPSVSDSPSTACGNVTQVTSGGFNVGDTNSNTNLDPGETWKFQCTASTTEGQDLNSTDTGTGAGTDSLGNAVPSTGESDSVTVTVTHTAPNSFP
jgi:archaellum component FlaG (FlaF/FlaG flagellin family)